MGESQNATDVVSKPFPDDYAVMFRGQDGVVEGFRPPADALDAFRDTFKLSGDWFRGRDDDPYVTYVVVRDKNPQGCWEATPGENDVFEAMSVGLVSMLSQVGDDGHVARRVRSWCSSRIRKVVKRASGRKWDRVAGEAMTPEGDDATEGTAPMHGAVLVDEVGPTCASVIVFAPMRASAQPASLRRLQVSGLSLDRAVWKAPATGPILRVTIDQGVEMTTGKAVAQAGHAVQLAFRCLDDARYARWASAGFHVDVSFGDIDGMSMAAQPDVTVTDAGFTEVRPGTRTCAAWMADEPVPVVSFA